MGVPWRHVQKLQPAWWAPASVVLGLLTWPVRSLHASAGLDPSWQIALHLAASRRLHYGHDIVFSYGPLGFLSQPVLVTAGTGAAAVLCIFAAHLLLCALVLRGALRSLPPLAAIAAAYAAVGVVSGAGAGVVPDYLVFFVLFLAVRILERDDPAPPWLLVLGGAAGAIQLSVKVNGGVVCFLILLLASWRARPGGVRSVALLLASYLVSFTAIWLGMGNRLSDLPAWLRLSAHVAGSFTSSLALEAPGRSYEYAEAGLVGALGVAAVLLHARSLGRARAVCLVGVWLAFCFAYLKEGFVRHDAHSLSFFAAIAIGVLAFTWRGVPRILAVSALAGAVASMLLVPELRGHVPLHPGRSAVAAGTDLADVLVPHRRDRVIEEGRTAARAALALDSRTLAELRGRTVDVQPYETAAAWAYGLRWRPEPVVQQYVALDGALDTYNAHALDHRGAARVLRELTWPALDGVHPLYAAPETFRVLLCRYRQLSVVGSWEVLARARNRCGAPRFLGSRSARPGELVAIPPAPDPRDAVVARIHVHESILERLEGLLLKLPHQPAITLGPEHYRFLTATATGPLVLRMPAGAGMPPAAGGAVDYSILSLSHVDSYRVDFYAMPLTRDLLPQPPAPGQTTAETVTIGGRTAPLVESAVAGRVDVVSRRAGALTVSGWAADLPRGVPADEVGLFAGGRLLARTHPSQRRPDVAAFYKSSGLTRSGFSLEVPLRVAAPSGRLAGASLRVIALAGDRASVLPGELHP